MPEAIVEGPARVRYIVVYTVSRPRGDATEDGEVGLVLLLI